jgi:hypothetical protein
MLIGRVETAQRDRIAGWVVETEPRSGAIEVAVVVDGAEIALVRADVPRRDLQVLGPYARYYGFFYEFTKILSTDHNHDVVVRFALSGEPLGGGKFRLPGVNVAAANDLPSAMVVSAGKHEPDARALQPDYVIHIGMPKTGTKYLQDSFCRNRSEMQAEGVYYPTDFWPALHIFAHHELFKQLESAPSQRLEQIFASLNASGSEKVLLSCEGFIGLHKDKIEILKELIGPRETQIVFYARRWSDWIPSQWQQIVKQGAKETFAEMYARTLATAHGDMGINYIHILDKFSSVFGYHSIQIVSYSDLVDNEIDLFEHFAQNILGWDYRNQRSSERVHESMGPFLAELMRCLNALESTRFGSSGFHIYQSLNSLRKDPTVQGDVERVFEIMRDYTTEIAVDDSCYPLREIFTEINERYAQRVVSPELGGNVFNKRRKIVTVVRPDFLLQPDACAAVHRIDAAVSKRSASARAKSAA